MDVINNILETHIGLVLKKSENGIILRGPMHINNKWVDILMYVPHYPSLKNTQLQIQHQHKYKRINNKQINQFVSINELFDEMQNLFIENSCNVESDAKATLKETYKGNLLEDISSLFNPDEYEIQSNADYSRILFTKFSRYENHFIEVTLPTLKIINHSLPSCIDWDALFDKLSDLPNLLQHFMTYLEALQPFYENVSTIDELCHVVEPIEINTKANYRTFALKDKVFLKLIFANPLAPQVTMSVSIIGPTSEVQHLRHVYSEGLRNWDPELDIHKNLLRIFNLCFFPIPRSTRSNETNQFCSICYSYKLYLGEVPIISCDNSQCNLIYHVACLREWFNTLADGRTFLNVALGVCPFCKTALSTSFQELLKCNDIRS